MPPEDVWHVERGQEPEGIVLLCWQCDSEHLERENLLEK